MSKRNSIIFVILAILLIGIAFVAVMRLLTQEDTWLCVNDQWVKHGNPFQAMPEGVCGQGLIGETSDWKMYKNTDYEFQFKYPPYWGIEEYGLKGKSQKIFQLLLAQPIVDRENNPNRKVFWSIDVWKIGTTDSQIAKDSGYSEFDVRDINIQELSGNILESIVPSAIENKTLSARLFIVDGIKYRYSLKTDLCNNKEDLLCRGIIGLFRITE